jgi:hypothetical protein
MLQQHMSASSCMRTRFVMEEHYTGSQHSTPFVVVFRNTLLTLLCSLVSWIPPSAHISCSRKQFPSDFWQADKVCWYFFVCLMNVCVSTALTVLWFQHSLMKLRFHHLLPLWWIIQFIDPFNTQLATAFNFSAIAALHYLLKSLVHTLSLYQPTVSSLVVAGNGF